MDIIDKPPFDSALEANRMVIDYVKNLHCHSDVAEVLIKAMKPCGDFQIFTPGSYRYLTVVTQKIIFGFAVEMDTIAFRLNKK